MFRRSWSLFKTSWSVIRDDKELLVLPIISGVCALVVMVSFALPIFLTGREDTATGTEFNMGVAGWVLTAVGYIVLAYVTIFFNAALVCAANERLDGGNPTIGSALGGARRRAGAILPWAIVSATVSVVLRAISERAGFVGQIVIGIIGIAWSLVTFLVLPIIVVEGEGVGSAIKRSAHLFKHTWGENMIGNGGIGLVGLLGVLAGIPVVVLLAFTGVGALIGIGVAVFVVWLAAVMVVVSALSVIFQTALYRYAATGEVGGGFTSDQIQQAFRPRRSRRGTV